MVKETEIRNSITEAVIRRSLNKPLITENTLPVIRQEKINKVIYDTNVTTLPVIFGGNKVTYLSEAEAKNYDFGNLFQQANTQEVQGQDFNFTTTTTTQNVQEQGFNTQDILGQGFTQTTQVQDILLLVVLALIENNLVPGRFDYLNSAFEFAQIE